MISLSSASAVLDQGASCEREQSFIDSTIEGLTKDLQSISNYKAKELATEAIFRQCKHSKNSGHKDIRIRNEKIRFSEFSNHWNVKDPVYFCKNNSGYKSYLLQMTKKVLKLSKKADTQKAERNKKNPIKRALSKDLKKAHTIAETKKVSMWDCTIQSYIKIRKRMNREQMKTFKIAYPNHSCTPVKK